MTRREKVLAGCLLGVVVGYGGYKLVRVQLLEPRQQLRADILKARVRQSTLRDRLANRARIISDWQAQTALTLGRDPAAAHRLFRDDVTRLLEEHNLTAVENWTIRPLKERREQKPPREGFVELPLSVRVGGKLGDLVSFLRDLYQRPYYVRVDKLGLRVESSGRQGRRRRADNREPQLSITMMLSTLVLPEVPEVAHPTLDPERLDDPNAVGRIAAARLAAEDPGEYERIAELNFFKLYQPPVVRREPLPEKPAEVVRAPEPAPKPVVDPRRDAHRYVLRGVGHLPDGPVAYVADTDEVLEPPRVYRLNDEIDDGRLVLIVPEGIVVRVRPPGAAAEAARNYFYPLGATFKERQEVDEQELPEIARLLRLVLGGQAGGQEAENGS